MIKELNIALIGCGNWGKNIARNLYEMGSLACVYDTDIKLSEKISYDYSLPTLGLHKIFKDQNINAIVLSARNCLCNDGRMMRYSKLEL